MAQRGKPGRGRWSHTFGALDLGTNNCRLLVARPSGSGFRVIDAFSRIVRLGEDLAAARCLSEAAIERTLAALGLCAGKLRRSRASRVRAVATEACRQANNSEQFFDRVKAETGIELETIDPAAEAHLALAGCASMFKADGADGRALMFDIGGGSTQISWLHPSRDGNGAAAPEILGSVSLPCGVVTLSERFGGHEVSEACFAAMLAHVGDLLAPFEAAHGIAARIGDGAVQMVGTSGTVTTLAAVLLDLPRYDRAQIDGLDVSYADMARATARLRAMDYGQRAAHPCVGPDRADLVIAGCAILDAIHRRWPVGRLRVADRGLRDGILLGLMAEADREAVGAGT